MKRHFHFTGKHSFLELPEVGIGPVHHLIVCAGQWRDTGVTDKRILGIDHKREQHAVGVVIEEKNAVILLRGLEVRFGGSLTLIAKEKEFVPEQGLEGIKIYA